MMLKSSMTSKFNKYLNAAHRMAKQITGSEAATWNRRRRVVQEMERLKLSPTRVKRMAQVTEGKRNRIRAKVGLGALAAGTLGIGAFRANIQRKERQLQERINQMYNNTVQY